MIDTVERIRRKSILTYIAFIMEKERIGPDQFRQYLLTRDSSIHTGDWVCSLSPMSFDREVELGHSMYGSKIESVASFQELWDSVDELACRDVLEE